jgi:hypothetical protein
VALEEQIVEWASECPAWHRHVLRRLARGETLGAAEYKEVAGRLAAGDDLGEEWFLLDDMPGAVSEKKSVRLVEIREVANVNALVPNQTLTAGIDGITVVYGDNASGKSGYARLVKRVVRARHHEEVLTNIFDRAGDGPVAEITIDVDGETLSSGWPDNPSPELGRISFFDAACGDAYISNESEITYRPSALFVLDGLIQACDGVRAEVDTLLSRNASESRSLPELHPDTTAAEFLRTLAPTTTPDALEAACALPPNVEDEMRGLEEEELRLRATDPSKERTRLQGLASKYERVRGHLGRLTELLSAGAATDLEGKFARAAETTAAAAAARSRSFDAEPLSGVGSGTWRALWDAARAFSQSECYRGEHFPVTGDGAHCVLCQQELDASAADRLARFEAFVEDRTQQQAVAAGSDLKTAVDAIEAAQVAPPEIEVMLADLESDDPELIGACREGLTAASARRDALLAAGEGGEWVAPQAPVPEMPVESLIGVVDDLRRRTGEISPSNFDAQLKKTVARRLDLESRRRLAAARDDVLHEIERRGRRVALDAARRTTDTTRITRKSTELTRSHVTTLVRDRFTRESDRLRLERVTLEDHGGQKGQLRHQPAFVGAVQRAALPQVLSEGEQTALGLAGFFTEVHFDDSCSAIILDDPVSSLDHVRREYVAKRLADLSLDRQVIVFTHDVSFVADLRRAADHVQVQFTERSVVRRGNTPGLCQEGHPWKSKDVKARLAQLDTELARIKRSAGEWDSDTHEKEVADWAGRLSETWERTINLELIGKVVDRTTLEVRPKMFRILTKITEDDDKEFQHSYARCSRWARRHDKSPELNYVAPTVDEMAAELSFVRGWFDRVRKYDQ